MSAARKKARLDEPIAYRTWHGGISQRLEVCVELRTVSEANAHEHWRKRARRANMQHAIVAYALAPEPPPEPPCTVRLTRIGRGMMDSDNAIGSLKHVRDAVAKWLGVDDGPSGPVTWEYGPQERAKYYAVRVEIVTAAKESA